MTVSRLRIYERWGLNVLHRKVLTLSSSVAQSFATPSPKGKRYPFCIHKVIFCQVRQRNNGVEKDLVSSYRWLKCSPRYRISSSPPWWVPNESHEKVPMDGPSIVTTRQRPRVAPLRIDLIWRRWCKKLVLNLKMAKLLSKNWTSASAPSDSNRTVSSACGLVRTLPCSGIDGSGNEIKQLTVPKEWLPGKWLAIWCLTKGNT